MVSVEVKCNGGGRVGVWCECMRSGISHTHRKVVMGVASGSWVE